jgi:hypothetical protein
MLMLMLHRNYSLRVVESSHPSLARIRRTSLPPRTIPQRELCFFDSLIDLGDLKRPLAPTRPAMPTRQRKSFIAFLGLSDTFVRTDDPTAYASCPISIRRLI